jgi:2-methylcitrate dehydratase
MPSVLRSSNAGLAPATICRAKFLKKQARFFIIQCMKKPLQNNRIAAFALQATPQTGQANVDQLKKHLLDSLGSLVYASSRPTIQKLVKQLSFLSEGGRCHVPFIGKLPVDRAAQFYTAMIRYPDFMDNYLGKEATCHPSDNIGALLAAGDLTHAKGEDFLNAMAISYQVECRLVEEIPVMKEGIDHTLFLAYSMTCGIARLLGLTEEQTAHALAISGCSISPMVTSRASYTYEWKGIASSLEAMNTVNIVLLAKQDMTGPIALFEGPKGFKEIFGMNLDYNWEEENFDLISKCALKRYNAEVHSQSAIDALLQLRSGHAIDPADITKIDATVFLTAYHIIGGGAYGDRKSVHSKEQADHSLFYLLAAAMLDGDVWPEQFEPERILQKDVQELLQKVEVNTGFPIHEPLAIAGILDGYTRAYPEKMKSRITVHLSDGKTHSREVEDYPGFHTRPFTWEETTEKFRRLSANILTADIQDKLLSVVRNLEKHTINELTEILSIHL